MKLKMCIYAVPDPDEKEGFKLTLIPQDKRWYMSEQDVMVGMTEVYFEPPENMSREEMALKAIETLKDKQKQLMADAQMRCNKLQARINDLLMLTHQPEPANESEHDENVIVADFKREGSFDDIPF